MAAKPETTFRLGVEKYLPPSTYKVKMHNMYAAGLADSWYSNCGKGDLWVEYKWLAKLPVRVPIRPYNLLEQSQVDWLDSRLKEGRNVAVIIGWKDGGVVLTDGGWNHDISVADFVERTMKRKELAEWIGSQ